MQSLTDFLREMTGCEAVGIRLREEFDFPYFVTRGFPPEFVLAETSLCVRDPRGELVRDNDGNPLLECMCGNVICGRFDPSLPFFTEHGSFWTNSTTRLLAALSEEDRQARTRNRCHGEGYESVALIPLRARGEAFGLVQINDSRTDRFSKEDILLLERMVDYVAVALSREQARVQLERSQEAAHALMLASSDPAALIDRNGKVLFANEAMCRGLGTDPAQITGTSIYNWLPTVLAEERRKHVEQVLQTGQPVRFEDSRQSQTYDHHLRPVTDSEGSVIQIAILARNITEYRRSQQALRESEQRYRDLIQWAPVSILVVQGGKYVFANPTAAMCLGYARPADVIGRDAMQSISPAQRAQVLERMRSLEQGRPNEPMEMEIVRADGTTMTVESTSIPIILQGKSASLIIGVDISQRKAAEESLRGSLAEKEVLLREIHHRVKNNLQVICSLLGLLAETIQDPAALSALREARDRVMAMAGVHQELYRGETISQIQLGEYLRELSRRLSQSWSRPGLSQETRVDDVECSPDTAILCGLIVNELYCNAFKHAFDPGGRGRVWLHLVTTDDGRCELVVGDDGRGLPAEIDMDHPKTLGLQLVSVLVRQMQAEMTVTGDSGCEVRIRFHPNAGHVEADATD